jgi:hypothetical protein
MFAWNIASHGYSARTSLFQNGLPVGVAANTDPKTSSVDDSSTSFAILRLNRNDMVNVHGFSGRSSSRFFAGWRIDENESEYLLFEDEEYLLFFRSVRVVLIRDLLIMLIATDKIYSHDYK